MPPIPPLAPIKLQGLNPAYLIAGKDGKPNPNFILQFNTLIQSLVDQINAIIVAFNLIEQVQALSIAPIPMPPVGDERPALLPLRQSPALPITITVGASPVAWQAIADGTVVISGGVSIIEFSRDGTSFVAYPTRIVPVQTGDIVRITFPVAPTVIFIEG